MPAGDVLRLHRRCQARRGVVRPGGDLVLAVTGGHRDDRTKDFFHHPAHVLAVIAQNAVIGCTLHAARAGVDENAQGSTGSARDMWASSSIITGDAAEFKKAAFLED